MSAENQVPVTLFQAVGGIFFVIAAFAAYFVVRGALREYRLSSLPKAAGLMESCEPFLSHTAPGVAPRTKSLPMWTVKAHFSYTVGGAQYEGFRISNIPPTVVVSEGATASDSPPDKIVAICDKYHPGASLQVYYHPENPRNSFVYFTSPLRRWPWVIPPLLAFFIGYIFILLAGSGQPK